MMRLVALSMLTALLADCSGSGRVEGMVPAWANTPPAHPTQYTARSNQLGRGGTDVGELPAKPAAEPQQEAKRGNPQSASEE